MVEHRKKLHVLDHGPIRYGARDRKETRKPGISASDTGPYVSLGRSAATAGTPSRLQSQNRSCGVAVMGSPEQTGAANMIPIARKLAGIIGRLQYETTAYWDYTLEFQLQTET